MAVTGAAGFIGRAAVHGLIEAGHEVIAITRDKPLYHASHSKVTSAAVGELSEDVEALTQALLGAHMVIHLAENPVRTGDGAGATLALTRAIARAATAAGVRRVVYASSIYATLNEAGHSNEYGARKIESETLLFAQSSFDAVSLRLPPVYGPGGKGGIAALAKLVGSGLPLPIGSATALRDYLALSNLVSLFRGLVEADDHRFKGIAEKSWEPSDGAPISTAQLSHEVGKALGRRALLFPVPLRVLAWIAAVCGKKEQVEAVFCPLLASDDRQLRAAAGWSPSSNWETNLSFLTSGP